MKRVIRHVAMAVAGLGMTATVMAEGPATAPATQPQGQVLATINGKAVMREDFVNTLMEAGGLRFFDDFENMYLTDQACKAANMPITTGDIENEKNRIIAKALGSQTIPDEQKNAVILQILSRQGVVSPRQAEWVLISLTGLHKLVEATAKDQLKATDDELKLAFDMQYGEKVLCRDIVVQNTTDAETVRKGIEAGKDPAEFQRNFPVTQYVISKADPSIKEKFKSVVFDTKEKTLSVSVADGIVWHLFYIDKKEPKQNVSFDEVKDSLRQQVMDQKEAALVKQHLANLKQMASVQVFDPVLAAQVQRQREMMQKQQEAAAAARGAAAPATSPAAPGK